MSLLLVKDSTNAKLRELESTTDGLLKVDVVFPASQTVTGDFYQSVQPVSAMTLPLPTGAATDSNQATMVTLLNDLDNHGSLSATLLEQQTQTNHLNTLSGTVLAGKIQVSSTATVISTTNVQVWTAEAIGSLATSNSLSVDLDAVKDVTIFGDSDVLSGNINIEVSHNDVDWFHLNNQYVNLDYSTGNFGNTIKCCARYLRLSKTNDDMATETISAYVSYKA
tara:strand:+ start:959 stop:1627 length:669 start_codon:yes stop_codon:yes gene_type:complete